MDSTDEKLIEGSSEGDNAAFEKLLKRYLKSVYNFIYRLASDREVAEDLTQETFVKVWKNLRRFDQTKSFKVWIFTIAKNTAYDFLKKKKTIPFCCCTDEEVNNKMEEIG